MSRVTTELAAGRLDSGGDLLIILNEPDDGPASVAVYWPATRPTTIAPERFGDVAAAMVKLFSEAHVELARIRSRHLR